MFFILCLSFLKENFKLGLYTQVVWWKDSARQVYLLAYVGFDGVEMEYVTVKYVFLKNRAKMS